MSILRYDLTTERLTGPEICADRTSTGAWHVRVVANKFPALRIEENERRIEEGPLFRSMGACGAHEVIIESPDHNLAINTAPRGDEDKRYFLWYLQILPRLTTPADFELGSGMAINTVMPEKAASYLREVGLV